MMRLLCSFLTCLSLFSSAAVFAQENLSSGISFYVLRVVYNETDKQGVSLTAHNNSTSPYLVQSWIRPVDLETGNVNLDWQGTPIMPFIVTPPLSRLEDKGELTLRIRRNDVPLPQDRESVFFISMKALPVKQNTNSSQMVMTVVTNMKLFYRPVGLVKRAVADIAGQLTFYREGKQLIASNPTPYWLTFSHLSVGGVALDNSALRVMVPPFSKQAYTLPASARGKVTWQLIDEDGWNTLEQQQAL
ncbi:fimbrial biogenesis chaperone [Providencia vermicola]|uniref:fimbrial biogenesis chaperone n=1 Tax=Providencia vermicola TaxID=333965 RepID=UPI0034E48070